MYKAQTNDYECAAIAAANAMYHARGDVIEPSSLYDELQITPERGALGTAAYCDVRWPRYPTIIDAFDDGCVAVIVTDGKHCFAVIGFSEFGYLATNVNQYEWDWVTRSRTDDSLLSCWGVRP